MHDQRIVDQQQQNIVNCNKASEYRSADAWSVFKIDANLLSHVKICWLREKQNC